MIGPLAAMPAFSWVIKALHLYHPLGAIPLLLSFLLGAIGVGLLPVRNGARVGFALAYVVLVGGALMFEALAIGCGWFGDCP